MSPPLFASGARGRVLLDYEVLDEVLQRVGATAALVLAELGASAYVHRGEYLTRTSERDLARRLGQWGRGFSRSPIASALEELLSLGWISRSGRGQFTLSGELFSAFEAAEDLPLTSQVGSPNGQVLASKVNQQRAEPVLSRTKLELISCQSSAHEVDDVSFSEKASSQHVSRAQADAVVRTAHDMGVRGKVLDVLRQNPIRGLAWLTYVTKPGVANDIPRYVNSMMLAGHSPTPPGFPSEQEWRIVVESGVAVLVNEQGERYDAQEATPPAPATIAVIDQALTSVVDNVYLEDHCEYQDAHRRHLERLRGLGWSGSQVVYLAHYWALRDFGLLTDLTEPFAEHSPALVQNG